MIINISKSELFTTDPDIRFTAQYDTPRGLWNLLYNRYNYLKLNIPELIELCQIKTGKKIDRFAMRRWVWRTEIYKIAEPYVKKGGKAVVSEVFGEYEEDLIKELTKHMKRGATKNARTVI